MLSKCKFIIAIELLCSVLKLSAAQNPYRPNDPAKSYSISSDLKLFENGVQVLDFAVKAPNVNTISVDQSWKVRLNGLEQAPQITQFTIRKGSELFADFRNPTTDTVTALYEVVQDHTGRVVLVSVNTPSYGWYYSLTINGLGGSLKVLGIADTGGFSDDVREIEVPFGQSELTSQSVVRCEPGDPTREVELAYATDFAFCEYFNKDSVAAETAIRALAADSEPSFSAVTCLIISPKFIELYCDSVDQDPYLPVINGKQRADVLIAFRDLWKGDAYYATVHRDIATLVTGYEDGTTVLGVAYKPGVCRTGLFDFSWVEYKRAPVYVNIHEVGHNFKLNHVADGVSGVMGATLSGNPDFSSPSITELRAFLLTEATSCLESPSPPPGTTPSPSVSATTTPSTSASMTSSPTTSVTPSVSPTASISSSAAPSLSSTPSISMSVSISVSPSGSSSPSSTPSSSSEPSSSASPSMSPSISTSVSASATASTSTAASSSPSPSASISASTSPSVSTSASASVSIGSTPSESASTSPSSAATPSTSVSPSSSVSAFASISSSPSPSSSIGPTPPSSGSQGPITPAPPSSKPSETKASESPQASKSSSPSPSVTMTPSVSTTPSVSVTPSPSFTPTPSTTPSMTPSPSVSPSPSPFTIEGCIRKLLEESRTTPVRQLLRSCADPRKLTKIQRKETRKLIRRIRRNFLREFKLNLQTGTLDQDTENEENIKEDLTNPFGMFGANFQFNNI